MIDKQKIRIMTNLAIYDKNTGIKDKEKNEMLQFDYVYKSNVWARISAFFGCLIILMFYVVKLVLVDQIDLFNFDYKGEATTIIYLVVAVLVFYTLVNGIIANAEYIKSQRRLNRYYKLLDVLDGNARNPQPSRKKEPSNQLRYLDKNDYEDEEYSERLKVRDSTRARRVIEDDSDDEIPANKYPDTRLRPKTYSQTSARTPAQRTPAPRTQAQRAAAKSKYAAQSPVVPQGYRKKPNLSVNKGAVKGKDGKYTSD